MRARPVLAIFLWIVVVLVWLLAIQQARAQWKWTEPAAHHYASVRVVAGNAGGSGTLIHIDDEGRGYVLTAAHVTEGHRTATAIWLNGHKSSGAIVAADGRADLALFVVRPPDDAVVIPASAGVPERDVPCEVLGHGGPSNRLRHFTVTVLDQEGEDDSHWQGSVISGDSGGGIVTGEPPLLVGVVAGGHYLARGPVEGGSHWPLNYPVRGAGVKSITQFLRRACPGGICQPCEPSRPGPSIDPSPGSTAPRPATRPPQPPAAPKSSELEALDKKLDALAEQIAKIQVGPPGPAGPPGPPGRDGTDAVVDYDRVVAEVLDRLDYDAIAARVPRSPPPAVPSPARHIVLVADQQASYWPRLADALRRAQEAYHGIAVAPEPPFEAGPMPQLVIYDGGTPIEVVQGAYRVEHALAQISRGEWK